MHSSTVTVAVIDPRQSKQYEFNARDFSVQWYSGTGAGGQHRNKHQNSCRITHLETGLVATAQCRSRENSFEEAKTAILIRLNEQARSAMHQGLASERKEQVGSGERGDKIRTYRFQDNVTKDHRTDRCARTTSVMDGNFRLIW